MEIIDWIKEDRKNSFISHYLIEAMSEVGNKDLKEFGKFNSEALEVEMKVNGIEVPFSFFFKMVEDYYDNYEKELESKHAKAVVFDRVSELQDKIKYVFLETFDLKEWEID